MGREVRIGDAVLYCGDCRDILPTLTGVDAVVTDPPYGVGLDYNGQWKDDSDYIKDVCVSVIEDCIKMAKTVAITPGTKNCHLYPQPDDIGMFYQPATVRNGRFGFAECNLIYYYGYYKNSGKGSLRTVYKMTENNNLDWHPCAKPINGWTWLVDRVSWENSVVLDPFMGSGTGGISIMRCGQGRKFIGIEIDEKYFNLAYERIQREYDQIKLFS